MSLLYRSIEKQMIERAENVIGMSSASPGKRFSVISNPPHEIRKLQQEWFRYTGLRQLCYAFENCLIRLGNRFNLMDETLGHIIAKLTTQYSEDFSTIANSAIRESEDLSWDSFVDTIEVLAEKKYWTKTDDRELRLKKIGKIVYEIESCYHNDLEFTALIFLSSLLNDFDTLDEKDRLGADFLNGLLQSVFTVLRGVNVDREGIETNMFRNDYYEKLYVLAKYVSSMTINDLYDLPYHPRYFYDACESFQYSSEEHIYFFIFVCAHIINEPKRNPDTSDSVEENVQFIFDELGLSNVHEDYSYEDEDEDENKTEIKFKVKENDIRIVKVENFDILSFLLLYLEKLEKDVEVSPISGDTLYRLSMIYRNLDDVS